MSVPTFDFSQDLKDDYVIVRAPLNVPVADCRVTNAFRIENVLPTLETLAKKGARVVVIAHIGREKTETLRPVWEEMKTLTNVPVYFCEQTVGKTASHAVDALKNGEILILENVRQNVGETKNDDAFADALADYGDMYINDAFSASHRAHASIVGIPKHIPGFIGPLFEREMKGINPAREPSSPAVAIIGGAKFVTKEPLLHHLVQKYDAVFIGGALVNDFYKVQGYEVGCSLVSDVAEAKEDIRTLLQNSKVYVPEHVTVLREGETLNVHISEVEPEDYIYDIAKESIDAFLPHIEKAKFILWNGPMGNFEKGFTVGTEYLAQKIADANGTSVVGGGDTLAAIEKLGLESGITHISTSGGAMLQYIVDGTLPGIDALS